MRKLPVYFLVDVSESMVGEPIQEVQKGIRDIIKELNQNPYALETVWVAVLAFAGKAETLEPLTELYRFRPPDFPIGGGTNIGKGLDLLMTDITKNVQKSSSDRKGDWKPIIFLFTDGAPTDNPEAAIQKWNSLYRAAANLVAVTFGDHADVNMLKKLTDNVFTLKDISSEAFREFFKWVSASIQVTSVALAEAGDEKFRLPSGGIHLEKAAQSANMDENYAVLRVKCSRTNDMWLAKYECGHPYQLVGSYVVDEERYKRLTGRGVESQINASLLGRAPSCPSCKMNEGGVAHCGNCGQLFCIGEGVTFKCPWCGNEGSLVNNSNFSVSRGQG